MRISITEAEGKLTELVKLAKSGEEIVLTQNGHETVRLEPVGMLGRDAEKVTTFIEDPIERDRFIQEIQERIRRKNLPPGPDAARSQDFLYDDEGLPR